MLYSFLNRVSKIKSTQCKSCIKQFLPEKELQEEANMQQSIASHTSGTVHTHTYRLQYNLNFLFCVRLGVVHTPKQVNAAAFTQSSLPPWFKVGEKPVYTSLCWEVHTILSLE